MASQIEAVRSSPERDEVYMRRVEHVIEMEGKSDSEDKFEACIFKVNEWLSRNSYAYAPSFISIGPYHHSLSVLRKEQLKSKYLESLVKRANGQLSRESLSKKLEGLKHRALRCYSDPTEMKEDKFVEMLLLDGCFLVEFVIRSNFKLMEKVECSSTHTVDDWTQTQVVRDMLLMENQLPFFVLNEIYQMIAIFDHRTFLDLVKETFQNVLPKLRYYSLFFTTEFNEEQIKHILQVVHILCCPGINEGEEKSEHQRKGNDYSTESCHIQSASELQEAGIRFKKVGDIEDNSFNNTNLFDIKFHGGQLQIPSFKLVASTETIFRNLCNAPLMCVQSISQNTLCSWIILSIPRKMSAYYA